MDTMLITGAGGLVGSSAVEHFHAQGYNLVGVDNNLRGRLLHDPKASTQWNIERLTRTLSKFTNHPYDIRDKQALTPLFSDGGKQIRAVVHCAAQTAHEGELLEDFQINTLGTLNLLDLWHKYCPEAVFVYLSTIKVYGNYPNTLKYERLTSRYDLKLSDRYYQGFDEGVSIDQGMSSFFGRSKTAADLYVQEYAYQFGLKTVCFRASCLTGGQHSGTEAHGMLSYMMRCAYTKTPYRIYGYEGLQVRDQLHAKDLVEAINNVITNPKSNVVYNIGGGRNSTCSTLEAIEICQKITGNKMSYSHQSMRTGDHRWWITDNSRFIRDYPKWKANYSLGDILQDIYDQGKHRW
jgi:CDP-paratose 2-epimerase